jgi:hypothetical protein
MNVALQRILVADLRGRGFRGSLPHFRRIGSDRIDLLTVQFNRRGGSFVIEIAQCPPSGVTMYWGEKVPPKKVSAWDVDDRHRLGSPAPGQDGRWFQFNNAAAEEVVRSVLPYLEEAEHWRQTEATRRGPQL